MKNKKTKTCKDCGGKDSVMFRGRCEPCMRVSERPCEDCGENLATIVVTNYAGFRLDKCEPCASAD